MAEQTLSIIGLGLIGGSIGLGVKQRLNHWRVVGYDSNALSVEAALSAGAIDVAANSLTQAITLADWIILAVPIGAAPLVIQQIARHAKPGTIVTDVASTKGSIVRLAAEFLTDQTPFVGSHPIAGSEKGGIASARPDLLYNALCVVTPTADSKPDTIKAIETFWTELGLRVLKMTPDEHDQAYAAVSHVPHAVAAAIINATPALLESIENASIQTLAGKGFMDTTRIAAGNPEMWRDILLSNSGDVKRGLLAIARELQELAWMLNDVHQDRLLEYLTRAAESRRRLGERSTEPPK